MSASATTLVVGTTATVTATATYSDGTSPVVTPTWSSSNTAVATVSTSGTVTGVAVGTATITGTFEEQSGSVSITVTDADVTTWTLAPSSTTVSESVGTVNFTVSRSSTGSSQTVFVSTVTDQGSANNGDYTGKNSEALSFSSGQSSRPVTLSITNDSTPEETESFRLIVQQAASDPVSTSLASATFTITDDDATVTSLAVSASATSVEVGATATVTATATYSDGTSAGVTPTWSSSNTAVATVSTSGTVTGVAVGTATITGTFGGQSDSVGMTVTAATAIEIDFESPSLGADDKLVIDPYTASDVTFTADSLSQTGGVVGLVRNSRDGTSACVPVEGIVPESVDLLKE